MDDPAGQEHCREVNPNKETLMHATDSKTATGEMNKVEALRRHHAVSELAVRRTKPA